MNGVKARIALLSSALSFCATHANAQSLLEQAGGTNPNLVSLAANIAAICPLLPANIGAAPQTIISSPQAFGDKGDLYVRCNAALRTANSGGGTAAGILLDSIAGEEIAAQDAMIEGVVSSQTQGLAARISALAGGLNGVGPSAMLKPYGGTMLARLETQSDATDIGRTGKFDGFATGFYGWGEKDGNPLEDGFEVGGWSLLVGGDYAFSPSVIGGLAIGYAATEVDLDLGAGSIDNDAWTVALYEVWSPPSGLYGSISGAYSWIKYESERPIVYTEPALQAGGSGETAVTAKPQQTINRLALGATNAAQYEISGRIGYTRQREGADVGPYVSATYRRLEIDGFAESGAQGLDLRFDDQETDSLLMSAGVDVAFHISTESGIVSPYAHLAYAYEAKDDARTINAFYRVDPFTAGSTPSPVIRIQTAEPDRGRMEVGGGVSAVFAGGVSAFLHLETALGQEEVSSFGLALGLRREF